MSDLIIIFLDKIDEDSRFSNDSETIASFVEPLMTDNKLLLNPNLQIIVSIWSVPFNLLKDSIRTQKYYCPTLAWTKGDLLRVFKRRVQIYSDRDELDFDDFFAEDVTEEDKDTIITLSNGNPRDLWHIFNDLFLQQFTMDENSNKISRSAVEHGLVEFVRNFNYFEYYPRKKGAHANTMDVYKYIAHLLKLSAYEFTANQLNTEAGAGSSAQNYISGMQSIGLVNRTELKRNAGVVYEIADPKVVYALLHEIRISQNS